MARTPLFALLRRTLQLAKVTRDDPRPAEELLAASEQARRDRLEGRPATTRGPTRRGFLAASGGAALAAGCASARGAATGAGAGAAGKVLVVGAGIAGLTAAHYLTKWKCPVTVVEAQNRIGGRMLSLRGHFADGMNCELGGELFDTPHVTIKALAKELDLELQDLKKDDPFGETFHFGGRNRTAADILTAWKAVLPAVEKAIKPFLDKEGEWKDVTYAEPAGAEALDRAPLAEWFARLPGEAWFRDLLSVGYVTEYGNELADQSSLNFLTMIGTEEDKFEIFGGSDERFRTKGGNDQFITRLREKLGDAVVTGRRLVAVAKGADGRITCTFQEAAATHEMTAEHVVLTLPFTLLREVKLDGSLGLPGVKKKAIAELGYGTNAKLMLGFNSRPWRKLHKASGESMTDLPYQTSWETSRGQPGESGIITNFTGGLHGVGLKEGTHEHQARKAVGEMDKLWPGTAAAFTGKHALFHWPSNPWVKGSYASYKPGQWTSIRGSEGEAAGNLHFAGEHTSGEFQGFMEGGAESGRRAAFEVLDALGIKHEKDKLEE